MEQVFSGQVLVETSARYEALTIEDGAVLTAPAGKFVCMTVNGVGCDPKPGRYVGDIALTLADSYPMAPHGLMRINGRGRDFQDALVVDTTAGQVVEAQCVPGNRHRREDRGRLHRLQRRELQRPGNPRRWGIHRQGQRHGTRRLQRQ